jgi:hypothetical protein
MNTQLRQWKLIADRLWAQPVFDYQRAAQFAADLAREASEPALQEAAADAMPYLRAACAKTADRHRKETAQRRFGAIRDALHAFAAAPFGRRGTEAMFTPEERYRHLLGLPLGRRLFGPEITRAFKIAAKKAHPDMGGSQHAFLELTAARDALMKAL